MVIMLMKIFIKYVNGFYQISSLKSNKLLDVVNSGIERGTHVDQWQDNGGDNQKWIIVANQDGTYSVVSKCNGLFLDIEGGNAIDGSRVIVWDKSDGASQSFRFEKSQTLQDGSYSASSALGSNIVLDIPYASHNDGARVDAWTNGLRQWQKFMITYDDGYYVIMSVESGKYLDVQNAMKSNGTPVVQWSYSGNDNQKWTLIERTDGSYNLISKCNGLTLDLEGGAAYDGVNAVVWSANEGLNQSFFFNEVQVINDGYYAIATALNVSKCLDVSGKSLSEGAAIGLWSFGRASNQKFRIQYEGQGQYSLRNIHSMKVVGVSGSSQGSKVVQLGDSVSENSRWKIEPAGKGSYRFVSSEGLCLDVPWANSSDGVQLDVWGANGGLNQSFLLRECRVLEDGCFYVKSGLKESLVLDVPNDSQSNLTQLDLWDSGNGQKPWQKFIIEYVGGDYYSIKSLSSRKALDVEGGEQAKPGSRVVQYDFHGGENQQWSAVPLGEDVYTFVSRANGMALDVAWAQASSGALIDVWPINGQANQRFKLAEASSSISYIPLNMTLNQMTQWQFDKNPYIKDYSWSEVYSQINPTTHAAGTGSYYQFADLRTYTGLSAAQIDDYINSGGSSGKLSGMGYAFVNASRMYGLNEAYFVCHTVLESGWGKSTLASGYYYDGVSDIWDSRGNLVVKGGVYPKGTYYNFFGIGAFDYDPITCGRAAAIKNGWSSQEEAVYGAASWITSGYMYSTQYPQLTLYDMKWDTSRSSATTTYGWHQYATDPKWATKIAELMDACYRRFNFQPNIIYRIPSYAG